MRTLQPSLHATASNGRTRSMPGLLRGIARWVADAAVADIDRWPLWLPVALACGIGIYFALPVEPSGAVLWPATVGCILALVVALRAAVAEQALRATGFALAGLFLAGFVTAAWRTVAVAAPVLVRPGVHLVEGRIAVVDQARNGLRVTLDRLTISKLEPAATPVTVRVTIRRPPEGLAPGDTVRLRARLEPPMPPAIPGGFDFARAAWFDRLGALGWSLGPTEIVAKSADGGFALSVIRLRERIAARFWARVPGVDGAVSAALFTGLRGAIDDATWQALQRSGLAHIISISGLHVSLVAVALFAVARSFVAMFPPLVLRWPARKLAAIATLPGLTFYLLLAGSSVPTWRSYLMTCVAMLAILADRDPVSMRLLALAAFVVLILQPESLVGASFQLSFAAVTALVAWYEARPQRDPPRGPIQRVWRYLVGIVVTTLIAGGATAPMGAFHFNTVAAWGSLANLIGIPLTAFWIMPAGTLAIAAMPFGLDGPFVDLTGLGVSLLLATARLVAEMPGAALRVAELPVSTLLLTWAGGLWICLWRGRWRWLGLPLLAGALLAAAEARVPLLLYGGDLVAIRVDGGWARFPPRGNGLVADAWLEALGQERWAAWPSAPAGEPAGAAASAPAADGVADAGRSVSGEEAASPTAWRCDPWACASTSTPTILIALHADGLRESCAGTDLLVSLAPGPPCGAAEALTRATVREAGVVAVRRDGDGLIAVHAGALRGRRPWVAETRVRRAPVASTDP